eukprot:jgi/Chlat1/9096/Chrsp97S08418
MAMPSSSSSSSSPSPSSSGEEALPHAVASAMAGGVNEVDLDVARRAAEPAAEPSHAYTYDGLPFEAHMAAGALAGMVEHMAMFPVDTVKTRMQACVHHPHTPNGMFGPDAMVETVRTIFRSEGPQGLYRGIWAMGLGAGPAHAVYFATYEAAKEFLGGNRPGHHPVAHATAGAIATVASDAVFTPMDVVKQRLQLENSPYRGIVDCVRRIIAEEGMGAFYRSYRTTVIMNIPFTAAHFATYESAKKFIGNDGEEEGLMTHMTAGALAGAVASAVTNPLDVVKTRLQTQGAFQNTQQLKTTSVLKCMTQIVEREGPRALMSGLKPRVLFHTPAAAICWSTYEFGKKVFRRWSLDGRDAKSKTVATTALPDQT